MQTAVGWLEQEFIKLESTIGVHGKMYELIEQAKEMEKQQIIQSILMWDIRTTLKEEDKGSMSEIEEFVSETYGSKESDETKGGELATFNTSSQTEISDEEIEKQALIETNKYVDSFPYSSEIRQYAFAKGFTICAKWYREQLKQRKYDRSND